MNLQSKVLGGLSCQLVDMLQDGQSPRLVVILCHGFGAPGTDLVPIGGELLSLKPALADTVRFVFPAAPLSLDELGLYGGRAWWHIDMAAMTAAIETGQIRDLREDVPEELPEARRLLTALVEELQQETNLPTSCLVLGGFSQGSMLATDLALRLPESPAALCVMSGSLVNESEWKQLAHQRKGLEVLQSHGRQDPILPFIGAQWLRDMFVEAGLNVDFIEFEGGHTIPPAAIERLASLLIRHASA